MGDRPCSTTESGETSPVIGEMMHVDVIDEALMKDVASGPGEHQFSVLISISGAYRVTKHWSARLTWNRVVTRYDRDTDVILAGIGYRW